MKQMRIVAACLLLALIFGSLLSCNQKKDPEPKAPNEAGYFAFGNYLFAIDGEVTEATLSELGTQTREVEEAPNCAFDGQNLLYSFSGFEVETYSKNGKSYFYAVYLLDDSIEADKKGITIGSSKSEVLSAYGDASEAKEGALIYRRAGYSLVFFLRDDNVTRIHYLFDVK